MEATLTPDDLTAECPLAASIKLTREDWAQEVRSPCCSGDRRPAAAACDHEKATQAAVQGSGELKQVSLTGYLTDSFCGKTNANAEGKTCAAKCVKKGAKVQLVSEDKTYTLDKVDKLEAHLGVEVKVNGQLDEATGLIKVETVENIAKG
jgi:hypothetical protein